MSEYFKETAAGTYLLWLIANRYVMLSTNYKGNISCITSRSATVVTPGVTGSVASQSWKTLLPERAYDYVWFIKRSNTK